MQRNTSMGRNEKPGWGRSCFVALILLLLAGGAQTETFATFPEHKQLESPDHRYVLHTVDPVRVEGEFSGVIHSLVIEDRARGQWRRIYDYPRRVAVAWSGDDQIIITDYVSKKSSRVLVFRIDPNTDGNVIDKNQLARLVPSNLGSHLLSNEHIFVEGVRVEGDTLTIRVWGYGAGDPNGFRLSCDYNLERMSATCREATPSGAYPQESEKARSGSADR